MIKVNITDLFTWVWMVMVEFLATTHYSVIPQVSKQSVVKGLKSKFATPEGKWSKIQQCGGCPLHSYKYNVGIELGKEEERSETWKIGLTGTAEKTIKTVKGTLGLEFSWDLTHRTLDSKTLTRSVEHDFTCDKLSVYQWTTVAPETNVMSITARNWNVGSLNILCTETEPICPPGFCIDEKRCDECTPKFLDYLYGL